MYSLSNLQGLAYTLAMAREYGGFGRWDTGAQTTEPRRSPAKPNGHAPRPAPAKSWVDEFRANMNSGG